LFALAVDPNPVEEEEVDVPEEGVGRELEWCGLEVEGRAERS
jgi:hypothetical protein